MNADQRQKPRTERTTRVIIDPDLHRVLFRQRADSGEPIQSQVNAILRKHFSDLGVVGAHERQPAAV